MRRFVFATLVMLAAPVVGAQDTGQTVQGVITAVALAERPRRVTVRLDDGAEVDALLTDRARVAYEPGVPRRSTSPRVADLRRGMTVRFVWNPARVERMTVLVVPPEPPPGSDVPSWSGAKPPTAYEAGRELRGRVLEANAAAGTLTVEVDGRRETFLADPRDLRTLRKDARVVIVTGEDGRVASVRQER